MRKDLENARDRGIGLQRSRKIPLGKNGPTRLICKQCNLSFFSLEAKQGRFFKEKGVCARCALLSAVEKKQISGLPSCFGKKFDGANSLCANVCQAKQACLIQYADKQIDGLEWNLSEIPNTREVLEGKVQLSFRDTLLIILRLAARPLHFHDLGPLLEKYYPRWKMTFDPKHTSDRILWHEDIKKNAWKTPQVVTLNDGFFVWRGVWEQTRHGAIVHERQAYYKEKASSETTEEQR